MNDAILCHARRERLSTRAVSTCRRKERHGGRGAPVESISIWFIAVSAWISSNRATTRAKGNLRMHSRVLENRWAQGGLVKARRNRRKGSSFKKEANLVVWCIGNRDFYSFWRSPKGLIRGYRGGTSPVYAIFRIFDKRWWTSWWLMISGERWWSEGITLSQQYASGINMLTRGNLRHTSFGHGIAE